jgi:hypothetical protein
MFWRRKCAHDGVRIDIDLTPMVTKGKIAGANIAIVGK